MQKTNYIEPEKITAGHAWRRYAARMLDSALFVYIILLITLVIGYLLQKYAIKNAPSACGPSVVDAGVDKDKELFFLFFIVCIVPLFLSVLHLLQFMCNAILMACIGNTFGKKLFGIKILHVTGRSLNFRETFKREILIHKKKLFILFIPFIGPLISYATLLLSDYRAYENLLKHKITSWDKQMNLKVSYRTQSVWITLAGVIVLIGLWAVLGIVNEIFYSD
ncbi:RDD family protein [Candidatus Cardinium hertigii]|uniref:RDD family protein n=1 Tax=Candidatus Cardinium hertigii TaxID=247481 RepID=UPI003D7C3B40